MSNLSVVPLHVRHAANRLRRHTAVDVPPMRSSSHPDTLFINVTFREEMNGGRLEALMDYPQTGTDLDTNSGTKRSQRRGAMPAFLRPESLLPLADGVTPLLVQGERTFWSLITRHHLSYNPFSCSIHRSESGNLTDSAFSVGWLHVNLAPSYLCESSRCHYSRTTGPGDSQRLHPTRTAYICTAHTRAFVRFAWLLHRDSRPPSCLPGQPYISRFTAVSASLSPAHLGIHDPPACLFYPPSSLASASVNNTSRAQSSYYGNHAFFLRRRRNYGLRR
jgi:hypothetical protein